MAKKDIPVWEKFAITVDEAAAYMNIGVNQLRSLSRETEFRETIVLRVGSKCLFKRERLEAYMEEQKQLQR